MSGKQMLYELLYASSFSKVMKKYGVSFEELNKKIVDELARRERNERQKTNCNTQRVITKIRQ
jgi:hypothetical protein